MRAPHFFGDCTRRAIDMGMDYGAARRYARQLFGNNADVRETKPFPLLRVFEVGVVVEGVFKCLGAGSSWEEAFNDVKPAVKAKGAV